MLNKRNPPSGAVPSKLKFAKPGRLSQISGKTGLTFTLSGTPHVPYTAEQSNEAQRNKAKLAVYEAAENLAKLTAAITPQNSNRTTDKKPDNEGHLPENSVIELAREIGKSNAPKTRVARSFVDTHFPDLNKKDKQLKVNALLRQLQPSRHGRMVKRKK
jgi:hypothetical protein